MASEAQEKTKDCYMAKFSIQNHNRDEIRSADLALISDRQMHRINACIFLIAITKKPPTVVGGFYYAMIIRSD